MNTYLLILLVILTAAMTPRELMACSYFEDEEMITLRDACEKDASKEWSCDLNRCVTTQESKEARDDYLECATIEDDTERKKCNDDYAKKYVGDLKNKETSTGLAAGINGVFATLMIVAQIYKSKTAGSCTSGMIVLGTGAVGVLSELYFRLVAEKKIDDLQKDYKKETNEDPYMSQLRALQYLKEEQEAMSKMAGNRKKAYMLMTAGYTTAAAVAMFELFKQPPSCGSTDKTPDTEAAPKPVGGEDPSGASSFGSLLNHPGTIAVLAGVGAALSGYMWKASSDQEKQSKENAEKVQEMIDKFTGTLAGYCPQGREDYNDPRCYCYNADGSKNSNRTKSETCQALWAQDDKNLYTAGNNYGATAKVSTTGCMTVNGQYDQKCACKKLVNNKGENACMKVPASTSTVNGLQSAISTATLAKNVNGITGGEFTAADLNSAELEKLAARANKVKNQITLQANDRLKRENKPTIPKLSNSFVDKAIRATSKRAKDAVLAKYAPLDLRSGRPADSEFNNALKKAINEGNIQDTSIKGGEGIHSGKKSGNGYQLNLGDSGSGGNKVENFMEKEYKMNASDIVNRDDIPIWTIISNRYTVSGLKRLFGDDLSKIDDTDSSEVSTQESNP